MKIAIIIIVVIVVIISIIIGVVAYKLNHLVTPELVDKIMNYYKENATDKAQTITTVHSLAMITSISSTMKGKGPITVTPALLNGEEITLITLGGTQNKEGQATTMNESALASKGKSNDYLKAVLKLFDNGTVPEGKPLLITGISLGGMIAQQLIGESSVIDHFDIKAVITFGSPLTMPYDRNDVKVVRFADTHDIVPKLGEMNLRPKSTKKELNEKECIFETSKYSDAVETHALSYIEDEVWLKYDFMGDTNKTNVLELTQDMTFYEAPILEKEKK